MSYTLGPLAITTAQPLIVPVGTSTTVGAVVVGNESPYAVSAQAGGSAVWALAQMANRLNCDSTAFSGNITLTADSYLSNQNEAPSYVVFLEVYAPGESIPGSYPCSLTRMSNVGNPSNSGGAANVIEQDLLTPFVLNGLVASKDGSVANQLDVTAGVALARQADQSLGRLTPASATFDTSAHSATYFLDLQTDGSWSWATSHSTQSNYLSIAQVKTDGSGNISAVTDERPLNTALLAAMSGVVELNKLLADSGLIVSDGAGKLNAIELDWGTGQTGPTYSRITYNGAASLTDIWTPQGGSEQDIAFITWNGSAGVIPLGLGTSNPASALTNLGNGGQFTSVAGQATAGSFGVPVIVAQAIDVHVTATTNQTICSFTPAANGFYRVSMHISYGNGSTGTPKAWAAYTDPHLGSPFPFFTFTGNGSQTSPSVLNGTASLASNTSIDCYSLTVYAKSGAAVSAMYQDPTGTPSDFVTALIERIS